MNDAGDGAGAVASAHLGDDAEAAGMVAAFGDFREGGMGRSQPETRGIVVWDINRFTGYEIEGFPFFVGERGLVWERCGRALEDLLDDGGGIGDLIEANECIHLRHFLLELGGKALGHASADDQFLAGATFQAAGLMGFEDGLDGFLLGGVDESAGVDYEDIGFLGVAGNFHAAGKNAAEHHFGIHEVLGAAEADHADFGFFGGRRRKCGRHG